MTVYKNTLTFKLPSKAQVALTEDLVKVISEHHKKSREHLFHLCMIAYGLRTHNLVKTRGGAGGNAKGLTYKPAFKGWYETNNLDDVYGSWGNFAHYAMAGRLLEYVRWQVGEKYISRLPTSLTALYALSKIVWSQGDSATVVSRKLFEKALIEPIRDGSKNNTFIHPHISRREIEEWITEQTPQNAVTKSKKSTAKNSQCTIVLATVKVHKDLLKFTKVSGRKVTGPKLEDVARLELLLKELITKFDGGKSKFVLESHVEEINTNYKAAQNPNFGKKVLPKKPVPSGKKSPSKKR